MLRSNHHIKLSKSENQGIQCKILVINNLLNSNIFIKASVILKTYKKVLM